MSGGEYFVWILIYSTVDIGVSNKKPFRSHDKNLAPLCASKNFPLNSVSDSKRDADVDAASSGYTNLLLPTVNLTLKGSGFSGH